MKKCKQCGNDFDPIFKYNTKIVVSNICSTCRIENNKRILSGSSRVGKFKASTKNNTDMPFKKKVSKKSSKSRLMTNADLWFSRYIRIKYAFRIIDGEPVCSCIINPNIIKHAKFFDNGHCYSRQFKATRYEEDNCRPQNRSSNRFKGEADHYHFIDRLKEQIGEQRFSRIEELRKSEGEDNEQFYQHQLDKYKMLTNKLIKELNVNKWW